MEPKKIYDLIILGAGPVGLSAAAQCGFYGMHTLIIESSNDYGGQPAKLYANKMIHDFPTYRHITGQALVDKLYDCAQVYDQYLTWQYNTLIVKYYFDDQHVIHLVDQDENEFLAQRVLLTVGKGSYEFIKPDLSNMANHPKVKFCLNHLTNTDGINKALVLGGGDGAVDLAIHLAQKDIDVSLVHRKPDLRAKGDPIARLNEHGVKTYLDYNLVAFDDDYLYITHNETQVQETLNYDLIVVQYGVCPLTTPLYSWDDFVTQTTNTKIPKYVVNQNFETSVKGFYAAGACITYENRFDLIITGIGEASIAVNHIYASLFPNKKGW